MLEDNYSLSFIDKVKYLFIRPGFFFDKIKSEQGIKNSALLLMTVGVLVGILNCVLRLLTASIWDIQGVAFSFFAITGLPYYVSPPLMLIVWFIFLFSASLVVHFSLRLFNGEGKYKDTFNVLSYSLIPFFILDLIPFYGFLSIIYTFVIIIVGLSKSYNFSKIRTILSIFVSLIFFIIFIGILAGVIFWIMGSDPYLGQRLLKILNIR